MNIPPSPPDKGQAAPPLFYFHSLNSLTFARPQAIKLPTSLSVTDDHASTRPDTLDPSFPLDILPSRHLPLECYASRFYLPSLYPYPDSMPCTMDPTFSLTVSTFPSFPLQVIEPLHMRVVYGKSTGWPLLHVPSHCTGHGAASVALGDTFKVTFFPS